MGVNLPSKNAYLSIYVSYSFLYATLAYTDLSKEKTSFLTDVATFPNNFADLSSLDKSEFWLSYFRSLEKLWKWEILETPVVKEGVLKTSLKMFASEYWGVTGCKVSLSKSTPNYKEIFNSLRKFSLDFKIVAIDKDTNEDLAPVFASKLEYDDFLLLDLNTKFFRITRAEREEGIKVDLSNPIRLNYRCNNIKIKWSDADELLGLLNGSKYKTFLSKYTPSHLLSNIWGNFLLNPVLETESDLLEDFIRGYITIQLLSLSGEKAKIVKDFGVKPMRNLVWITGDLVKMPKFKQMLMAVIDGLQLRGAFDICLDSDSLIYTLGKTFSLGEKSDEIFIYKKDFLPSFIKVYAPDIDLKPDVRKVAFDGTLFAPRSSEKDVFAMSSEITEIAINDPKDTYLEGKFVRNAYIEGYKGMFEFRCFNDDISWSKIVFDCRIKPVVYGPDVRANNIKFNMWLSE